MNLLTTARLAELWTRTRAGHPADDPDLACVQEVMRMHEELHDAFDAVVASGGAESPENVELMMHVVCDASTLRALELGQPSGVADAMQALLDRMPPGDAFHALSDAMRRSVLAAAAEEREWDGDELLAYAWAAIEDAAAAEVGS